MAVRCEETCGWSGAEDIRTNSAMPGSSTGGSMQTLMWLEKKGVTAPDKEREREQERKT